jgi:hypothetical protein
MDFAGSTSPVARRRLPRLGRWLSEPGRAQVRPVAAAAAIAAVAAAATVSLAPAASASGTGSGAAGLGTAAGHGAAAIGAAAEVVKLALHPMPAGTVRFGRTSHRRLVVHVAMYGLTPGSSHRVDLIRSGGRRVVQFSLLRANSSGQADEILASTFKRRVPGGSRLVIRMGAHGGRIARLAIAVTRHLRMTHFRREHRLRAVETSSRGAFYGTPRGRAVVAYNPRRQTLTVTVSASGLTPGPHAAHVHLGSCQSQGPVKYMLRDLVANRHGKVTHAVRVFTHITSPVPASGWYLNVHQGNSADILSHGQPTIYFRPLICANIKS